MKKINKEQLKALKISLDDFFFLKVFTAYKIEQEGNFNFLDYYCFSKELEKLKENFKEKFLTIKYFNFRGKSKKFRWINRILKSSLIVASIVLLPNVRIMATTHFLKNELKHDGLITNIWKNFSNNKKTEKRFSKKFIIITGSVALLALGSIIYYRENLSRIIFKPTLVELLPYEILNVAYTIEEKDIFKRFNLEQQLQTRQTIFNKLLRTFGPQHVEELIHGKFPIGADNLIYLFKFLTRLFVQTSNFALLKTNVSDYTQYFNPKLLNEVEFLNQIMQATLFSCLGGNPELNFVGPYFSTVFEQAVKAGYLEANNEVQEKIIRDLTILYFNKN